MENKITQYSILLNIILAGVIVCMLKECHCPDCGEVTTVKIDTIRPKDTTPKVISVSVPVAVKSIPKKHYRSAAVSQKEAVVVLYEGKAEDGMGGNYVASAPCDTINIYSDTIHKPDTCTIIIKDTVEGRILGRSVLYANLQPLIRTTVTKTIKEKWKVYVGGAVTVNAKDYNRWGVGVTGAISIPKVGLADYTYDIKNNAHTVGVLALIRFKK